VNREQAIWYQQEVADMMLIAGLYARNSQCDFGTEYWNRWTSMLGFIASIMDVAGNVPRLGDADDAVIARLDPARDFDPFRSLLASGAVLSKDAPFARAIQGEGADARRQEPLVAGRQSSAGVFRYLACATCALTFPRRAFRKVATSFLAAIWRVLARCASSRTPDRSDILQSPRTAMPTRWPLRYRYVWQGNTN
jgi:hypothetical protein